MMSDVSSRLEGHWEENSDSYEQMFAPLYVFVSF